MYLQINVKKYSVVTVIFNEMALTEAALKKLTEEESIKLALNLQDNCNKT